jgi:hypothetical protein
MTEEGKGFLKSFPFWFLTRRYRRILKSMWSIIAYMPKIALYQTNLSF